MLFSQAKSKRVRGDDQACACQTPPQHVLRVMQCGNSQAVRWYPREHFFFLVWPWEQFCTETSNFGLLAQIPVYMFIKVQTILGQRHQTIQAYLLCDYCFRYYSLLVTHAMSEGCGTVRENSRKVSSFTVMPWAIAAAACSQVSKSVAGRRGLKYLKFVR